MEYPKNQEEMVWTLHQINDAENFIRQQCSAAMIELPTIGIVLGTGWRDFANIVTNQLVIPYDNIPHLPVGTAPGHSSKLIIGKVGNKNVMIMQGRLHLYEGHHPTLATLLIRVMKKMGIDNIIITCAAGGMNKDFAVGDLMLINDHINFFNTNPLIGYNLSDFGSRFPVMFDIYTKDLRDLAINVAKLNNIVLHQGVYAGIIGPTFATRAELKYMIHAGGDAIGMSVIPEAIVAAHSSMNILAFAAITDMALPNANHHSNEQEIIEVGKKIATVSSKLLRDCIALIK